MAADYTGKFRLWRTSDWAKLPAMRWLVENLIVRCGVMMLFGLPKFGKKSFIGISLACAAATGKDWCGLKTQKVNVLYIAAEGFYGILRRQAAWEKLHGCSIGDNLRYLRVPINFFNAVDIGVAVGALQAQGFHPDFIVIDTLARSMSGGKENATEHMNTVFEQIEQFRTEIKTDGVILVIAHTTKDGLNYRGASSQGGAVDGLIESRSKPRSKEIELISRGFKDADEFEPFTVVCQLELIETEDGPQQVLAVKERVQGAGVADDIFEEERPTETEGHGRTLVRVLFEHFSEQGARRVDLEEQCKTVLGMSASTFERGRKYATQTKDWVIGGGGRGMRYKLNPNGSWKAAILAGGYPGIGITSTSLPPLRGEEVSECLEVTSMEASWKRVGSDSDQNATEPPKADPTVSKANELLKKRSGGPDLGKKKEVVGS